MNPLSSYFKYPLERIAGRFLEIDMANKRFIIAAWLTTGFVLAVAAGVALVHARGQVATIQPFVAIMVEEVTPRPDQPPTPITRLETIAVRSDGSIANVTKWDARLPIRRVYSREVMDTSTRTHVFVEDYTKTVINDKYFDLQVLHAGAPCEGKPAGQRQGFDVVYAEQLMGSSDQASKVTHKQWKAPQLGCYPIIQEWVGNMNGLFNDTTQTLASIKLGEPDPWYFNVPADYTVRTGDEWRELMMPLLTQ